MRMLAGGVGLLSLLIGVAIVAYLWAKDTKAVSDASKSVMPQVRQWAGQDENGMKITDSITFNPVMQGSDVKGLTVATIVPAGPMAVHFGLRVGDDVTQVSGMPLDGYGSDPDLAKSIVFQAYQTNQPITIERAGVQMTLPAPAAPPVTPKMSANPSATPAAQSPANPPVGNHVQNQLNQLKRQMQAQ